MNWSDGVTLFLPLELLPEKNVHTYINAKEFVLRILHV